MPYVSLKLIAWPLSHIWSILMASCVSSIYNLDNKVPKFPTVHFKGWCHVAILGGLGIFYSSMFYFYYPLTCFVFFYFFIPLTHFVFFCNAYVLGLIWFRPYLVYTFYVGVIWFRPYLVSAHFTPKFHFNLNFFLQILSINTTQLHKSFTTEIAYVSQQ
jgi:hypothetical protein